MKIGVNTFGLASCLHEDFPGTFQSLRTIGYTTVEPCIIADEAYNIPKEQVIAGLKKSGFEQAFWLGSEAHEKIAGVREMGFEVIGAHISMLDLLPGYFDAAVPYLLKIAT